MARERCWLSKGSFFNVWGRSEVRRVTLVLGTRRRGCCSDKRRSWYEKGCSKRRCSRARHDEGGTNCGCCTLLLVVALDNLAEANGVGAAGAEDSSQSREAVLAPLLDVLSSFRDRARACGRAGDAKGVLAACDHVRDEMLPTVGVRLEDKGDQVGNRG